MSVFLPHPVAVLRRDPDDDRPAEQQQRLRTDAAVGTVAHNHFGLTALECPGRVVASHPSTAHVPTVVPDFLVPSLHAGEFPATRLALALHRNTSSPGTLAWLTSLHLMAVVDVAASRGCAPEVRHLAHAMRHRLPGARVVDAMRAGQCSVRFLSEADQDWYPTGLYLARLPDGSPPLVGAVPLSMVPDGLDDAAPEPDFRNQRRRPYAMVPRDGAGATEPLTADDGAGGFGVSDRTMHAFSAARSCWTAFTDAARAHADQVSRRLTPHDASALLEEAPLLLLEEDAGQCDPGSFVEVHTGIAGLTALLDPVVDGVMTPVKDVVGGVMGTSLGGALIGKNGKSTTATLENEITALLTQRLVPRLTETLVPPIQSSVTDQVSHSLTATLRDAVDASTSAPLTHALAKGISSRLMRSLPPALRAALPPPLAKRVTPVLLSVLTRSVVQSTVPALVNVLGHSPATDYYCFYCTKYNKFCNECHYSPTQLVQAQHYASYYSQYYAAAFAAGPTPDDAAQLPTVP